MKLDDLTVLLNKAKRRERELLDVIAQHGERLDETRMHIKSLEEVERLMENRAKQGGKPAEG